MGAASLGVVALALNLAGQLFDRVGGATSFLYFNGGLAVMAAAYLWLRKTLQRHSARGDGSPKTPPAKGPSAPGISLAVWIALLAVLATYAGAAGFLGWGAILLAR